jgi:hypothetical protein
MEGSAPHTATHRGLTLPGAPIAPPARRGAGRLRLLPFSTPSLSLLGDTRRGQETRFRPPVGSGRPLARQAAGGLFFPSATGGLIKDVRSALASDVEQAKIEKQATPIPSGTRTARYDASRSTKGSR